MIVTVVGTGYVGLVTGTCLAAHGHTVRCVEISEERLQSIRAWKAPFYEPGLDELLRQELSSGRLSVTSDLSAALAASEITLIAVGTPPQGEEPDLTQLETAAAQIGAALRTRGGYHVIVVKSTVVPGTTRNVVQTIVARESGMPPGAFGLCMNPEFLREGSAVADFLHPDRIIIGQADNRSGNALEELYRPFACERLRVSIEEAELTKYASNALLGTLISFSNEMASLCESTSGADVETVMQGLYLDRRLSPVQNGVRIRPDILSYLRAGIGFGGSCLPKDVNALRSYARRAGVATPMLDAVVAANDLRPARVVAMAEAALGGLSRKTIALLGVAFKAGTDDLRSSPALSIFESLRSRGASVQAYDPVVSGDVAQRAGLNGCYRSSIESALRDADAAVITTTESAFRSADWARLAAAMRTPVVIDGRNLLHDVRLPDAVRYYSIGREMRLM